MINKFNRRRIIITTMQVVLVVGAVCLIFAGIKSGEMMSIFRKARFICMECIGIG